MKPVWIVDDDQSIRWVLEKALQRENMPYRSFTNPQDVLDAFDNKEEPQVLILLFQFGMLAYLSSL